MILDTQCLLGLSPWFNKFSRGCGGVMLVWRACGVDGYGNFTEYFRRM